jgi:hypothetical protein
MAKLKTIPTNQNVNKFLETIKDEKKRKDSFALVDIMQEITKADPKMWGENIIGFGDYHYKYKSGREGDWFLTGFSPRKQNLTVYIMGGLNDPEELSQLGKYKNTGSCLYFKSLDDLNIEVLKALLKNSIKKIS